MSLKFTIKEYITAILENPEKDLLESLRAKMINVFITVLFFVVTIAATLSVLRALTTGWRPLYAFQIVLVSILFFIFIYKKKIPTAYKSASVAALFFIGGISGVLNFGLISQSNGLFTMAILISLLFLSIKTTLTIMISTILFLVTMTTLVSKDLYTFSVNFDTYAYAPTSWITIVIGFTMLVSLIVFSIGRLIYTLIAAVEIIKEKNSELIISRRKLEKALAAKSDFLANMSHEIRTPMNAMLGFIEQLAKSEKDLTRQGQFQIIESSGNSLLTIINDILDLSKIESGKLQLELQECDVDKMFFEIVSLFEDHAKQCGIELEGTLSENFPKNFAIDVLRIKQIINNLLSNAIKFSSKGGKVELKLDFDEESQELIVHVTDTGIGISQSNQEKIFHAFEQEDSSTTRRFGGTGLGLSICKKLVDLMDGTISVKSQEGEGSCFSFSIPVQITEGSTPEPEPQVLLNNTKKLQGNILVVEDNKTNQLLIGVILDELKLDYSIANDGLEALQMLEKHTYDIVLMDENMPNMNGIEATKVIRGLEEESGKRQVIIAVTANVFSNAREHFMQAGMDDYIAKPYTEKQIQNVLLKFL